MGPRVKLFSNSREHPLQELLKQIAGLIPRVLDLVHVRWRWRAEMLHF